MTLTVKSSKVTPVEVKPAKQNNLIEKQGLTSKIKYIVYLQAVVGINRTYLLKCGRFVKWLTKIWSFLLVLCAVTFIIILDSDSTSFLVIQDTSCIEFILLVFNSMAFQKKTFENFIANMNTFDEILNISSDLNITSSGFRSVGWMFVSLVHSVLECLLFIVFGETDYIFIFLYLTMMAHDSEQIIFCGLLRMILNRVYIVKAHVAKHFGVKESKEMNKLAALSNNAQLDTISLHRMYELLHKCAEQLNSIMSLPMMVSLFCSGLSSTMLLKALFKILQMDNSEVFDPTKKRIMIVYITVRCLKYTLLVVAPCYYSSVTTTQVTHIRTMLHDTVNSGQLDKIEKRRVKAFFQLTRENEFAYALWGVIRLNMSLPLSYSSLCTTYLVIIIQFSKFID